MAQAALPVFLQRVRSILHLYRTSPKAERHILQGCLCCLETLAAMTLAPAVTDVVLPPSSRLKVSSRYPVLAIALGTTISVLPYSRINVHDEKENGLIANPFMQNRSTSRAHAFSISGLKAQMGVRWKTKG